MVQKIKKLAKEITALEGEVNEIGYYPDLKELIEVIANEEMNLGFKVRVSPKKMVGGFPDIKIVRAKDNLVLGHIEVKIPNENLDNKKFEDQFNRYKESASNIIFTNFGKWELWQWDKDRKSKKKDEATWNFKKSPDDYHGIKKILEIFNTKEPIAAETPEELADLLARRNKRLREVVEEVYVSNGCPQNLKDLYETIKEFLIKDITVHDYVNMYAETITYSLFIARLQHFKKGGKDNFDIDTAFNFLHRRLPRIPLLDELYNKANDQLVAKIEDEIDLIIQDLKLCDIKKIYEIFTKHDPDKDPIIYFYEPFVKYNDPETKIKRGVFYTPKPIANFITRSINEILKEKFGLHEGLANENIRLLDPAMGTGTFLVASIERIYEELKEKYKNQGATFLRQKWEKVVQNHILERFYGFEILLAPYAIAHLKLSLYLEENGYEFEKTSKNQQFKLYLTNTLENDEHSEKIVRSGQIGKESEAALKVKNDEPVLVITGNPPYSVSSFNKNKWIEDLMNLYKKAVRIEKNIQPLSDDYIKFIRFGQWKINKTGHGIFAMITNHSFLDGLIHRGMREELMKEYDQIYIYNLHGNTTSGEINPNNRKDQNVFDIKQGVAISFFIKSENCKEKGVWYSEIWGTKEEKLVFLNQSDIRSIKWLKLEPQVTENFFFIPKILNKNNEYDLFYSLKTIFPINGNGIKTNNDNLFLDYEVKKLKERIELLKDGNLTVNEINKLLELEDDKYWNTKREREKLTNVDIEQNIFDYLFRPFDIRKIYYQPNLIEIGRGGASKKVFSNFKNQDLGLINCRQFASKKYFTSFVTKAMADMSSQPFAPYNIFPIYVYENGRKVANLDNKFIHDLENSLNLIYVQEGEGDLKKDFGPEDIFYYIYSVFHSPEYRKKYHEELKIAFPKVPLAYDKIIFRDLVRHGKNLIELHLLNQNPFSTNKNSIFNKQNKWRVSQGGKMRHWNITKIQYEPNKKRIYINENNFFQGIDENVWNFYIGGYQVLDKWLKARKGRTLNLDDQEHFMKMIVALRETINVMEKIDPLVIELLEGVEQPQAVTPKTGRKIRRKKTLEEAKKIAHQLKRARMGKRVLKKSGD